MVAWLFLVACRPMPRYGSMPTRGKYLHEMALRILLHSLETSACRYRRHIVPVISCGIDFYVRVFVRVFESAAEVKKTTTITPQGAV